MTLLDHLSIDQLLWLVPVFFTLHNLEEAPFMAGWSKRLPIQVHPTVTTRQFTIAVIFLTISGFLITYYGVGYLHNPTGYLLVLGIQMILFFNAFLPHIGTTIRFRMYSPGIVTAVLITLPFSIYLFQRAMREGVLSWSQFWILLAMSPFAMVLFAYLSLRVGSVFDS